MTAAKCDGGLGVGSIKALNTALIVKWWWRLRSNPDLLWSRAITGIHNLHSKPDDYYANKNITGTWKNIAGMKKELVKAGIPVSDVLSKTRGNGEWRCNISNAGRYTVKCLRNKIDKKDPANLSKFDWVKEIPKKVLCFAWRAKMGRIPSAVALSRRGILNNNNTTCSFCNQGEECADHILVNCTFAKTVLEWILKWCDIRGASFCTVSEILDYAAGWGNCPKKRRILQTIIQGTLWSIWKARNERLFGNRRIPPTVVADIVKSSVFLWVKYRRSKGETLNWTNWCINPFS